MSLMGGEPLSDDEQRKMPNTDQYLFNIENENRSTCLNDGIDDEQQIKIYQHIESTFGIENTWKIEIWIYPPDNPLKFDF